MNAIAKLFADQSSNQFTDPRRCIGNLHLYVIRKSILKYVHGKASLIFGDVVDLGCGSSPYKDLLLSCSGKITSYTGVDIDSSPSHVLSEGTIKWNGISIPLPDCSFDCVLMTEVIEHLPDYSVVLSDVFRILRPNGILVATIPFLYPLHEIPYDFRRLTPYEAESVILKSGFRFSKVTRFGGWDRSLAQMLGLWLTSRPMSPRLRKLLMLCLYPFYSLLLFRDKIETSDDDRYTDTIFVGIGIFAQK